MGWLYDNAPEHEGYLAGLVPFGKDKDVGSSASWRELSYVAGDEKDIELRCVQAACECGWRSPRIDAPPGTKYSPYIVIAPDWFEERGRARWTEHVELELKGMTQRHLATLDERAIRGRR